MKNIRTVILAAVMVIGGVLVMLSRSLAEANKTDTPAVGRKIAVCDVPTIMARSQRGGDLTETFDIRRKKLLADEKSKAKAITDIQSMLKELKPGTKDFKRQIKKIRHMLVEMKVWREVQEMDIKRDRYMITQSLYSDVLKAAADVAKERGIDLVLNEHPGIPPNEDMNGILERIRRNQVIYSAKDMNLTDEILKRFDAAYKASKKTRQKPNDE